MIILRTLGECIVEVDGEPLGPDADSAFAILILLAAERGRQLSRRHVAELFWPGFPESRARHALRQLLYRLRGLGVELDAGREHVRLDPELIVPTFASDPTVERMREAQAAGTLVVGPYLPGYAPRLSPAFQEWLDAQRSVVEAQVRKVLLQAAQEHQNRGEWMAADALARECLRIDPLNEEATYKRAECAAMMGGKAEALAILDRYNAEMADRGAQVTLPTTVLRRRIAEQLPLRRYAIPSDRCFVGRESLMAVLTVALLRAKNREGSGILLWGPSGIGKTRVTQELMTLAAVQGLRVVRVQCEESDARQPMAAWVDGVPQLLRIPGALGVSPDAMPFLRRLTEFDPTPREPSPEARDPQYLAGRIRQAIIDLVDAVANEGPLLLVFEDVHWIDGASWAALRLLLEWNTAKPVLILLTSRRPHATGSTPQRELPRLELHEVRALEPAAASLLVRAIAADFGSAISDEAEAWCLSVSEGNPLYLRELVVDCLEAGRPRAVPPSVQALLDARIARVRPGARQVLQACATLGEHATVDRLDAVLGMPTYDLVAALDELSESGLVASVGATVQPRHEVVAGRIAAATSEASRRLLHRRSAMVLEREVERGASLDVMWACTRHWTAAGDAKRAFSLAISAATQLIEVGSPQHATAVCDEAAHLCTSEHDQFALDRLKASAHGLNGQWHHAAHLLGSLLDRERDRISPDQWGRDAIAAIVADARANGFRIETMPILRDIAADRRLDPRVRLEAGLYAMVISANLCASSVAHDAWSCLEDVTQLRTMDDVLTLRVAMAYHISFGKVDVGAQAAALLLPRVVSADPAPGAVPLLLGLAEAYHILDQRSLASELAAQAFSLSVRFALPALTVRTADKLAALAIEDRDPVRAARWLAEAREHLPACNDALSRFEVADTSARLLLLTGNATDAVVSADANLEAARRVGPLSLMCERAYLTTLVEAHLECHMGPVDASLLDALADLHDKMQQCIFHDRAAVVLASAIARTADEGRARELLEAYINVRRGGPRQLSDLLEAAGLTPAE